MATRTDNERIGVGLAIVITLAWIVSFLVDILVATYEPPYSVHLLMMTVAGTFFGGDLIKKRAAEESKPTQPAQETNND